MHMKTCQGCVAAKKCEIASGLRNALSGLGITSIKHRCAVYKATFQPGEAVFANLKVRGDDVDEGSPFHMEEFPAYVVRQNGRQVIMVVSPNAVGIYGTAFQPRENERGYIKITMQRVRHDASRHRADASPCEMCGNHPNLGAPCNIDWSDGAFKCPSRT